MDSGHRLGDPPAHGKSHSRIGRMHVIGVADEERIDRHRIQDVYAVPRCDALSMHRQLKRRAQPDGHRAAATSSPLH